MFEHLLDQVGSRHGLSPDQARRLLAAWLDRIFDPARGGTAGFVEAFRAQGLEELAASWIAPGPNRPLTADQLERVFGEAEIAALAQALDLPAAAVASASAAILPEAVDTLGEDGRWHGGGLAVHAPGPDPQQPAPAGAEPPTEPPAYEPIGLHPIRDAAPGPLSSEPAPLYRANDAPPSSSPSSFLRRVWPWLALSLLLIALVLLLRA